MEELINGPINVVRMEGKVNNVKKVIYIFMDFHMELQHQTKCPSFVSLDFYQYLAINLKKTNIPLDFMFEISKSNIKNRNIVNKEKYIIEVLDFFNSEVSFKDNKIQPSKSNRLVRYHYIDIRDLIFYTIDMTEKNLTNIFNTLYRNQVITVNDAKHIKLYLNDLMKDMNLWKILLFDDNESIENKINEYKDRIHVNTLKNTIEFVNKIRNDYKNKEVRKNLQVIFDLVKNYINHINKLSSTIIDKLNKNKKYLYDKNNKLVYDKTLKTYTWGMPYAYLRNLVCELYDIYDEISYTILKTFADIMDIFFMRRFLDKNYIVNAISYTGISHSINYIQHLLTKYDFKITHYSYSLEPDINKLNKHLKEFDNTADRREYEKYLYMPEFVQCSDLSSFPPNFT